MAPKDPAKKMPLMAENAIMHSTKLAVVVSHHLRAHYALRWMHGTVLIAQSKCVLLVWSLTYVSMRSEYVLLWIFLTAIWNPEKHQALGDVTSVAKLLLRFLLTIPLKAE